MQHSQKKLTLHFVKTVITAVSIAISAVTSSAFASPISQKVADINVNIPLMDDYHFSFEAQTSQGDFEHFNFCEHKKDGQRECKALSLEKLETTGEFPVGGGEVILRTRGFNPSHGGDLIIDFLRSKSSNDMRRIETQIVRNSQTQSFEGKYKQTTINRIDLVISLIPLGVKKILLKTPRNTVFKVDSKSLDRP
jgi:hypothetical protein